MRVLKSAILKWPSTFPSICLISSYVRRNKHWESAVSSAEKVVGYPTSFMNLRFWLSDEMSNVAVNMRKLIGTKHPLMKTAKGLIFADKENIQTRGLVVLLISKAAGIPKDVREFEHHNLDKEYQILSPGTSINGILETQRSLAELTEMIHTAFVLHRCIMDIDAHHNTRDENCSETDDLLYGNKMALLSGDYLLAKASSGLASLGNTHVVEVMASAISDLMESQFYVEELQDSCKKFTLDRWENVSFKTSACLYAKSCQSALMLSGHQDNYLSHAFNFGKYFGLLRYIKQTQDGHFNSEAAVVDSMDHLMDHYDVEKLKLTYAEKAAASLKQLPASDASEALHSFLCALSQN